MSRVSSAWRGLVGVGVLMVLGCTGCSATATLFVGKSQAPQPAAGSTASGQQRLPRLLGTPSPASVLAHPPAHANAAGRAFVAGLNGYCHTFYSQQRAADERFGDDSHAFSVSRALQQARLFARLATLRPSGADAAVFQQFTQNEQRLVQAMSQEASEDSVLHAEGVSGYDGALVLRHGFARRLGASECDGLLPATQWRAVARATQRFALTRDRNEACGTLVTPLFLNEKWGSAGNKRVACARDLRRRHEEVPGLRNIRVTQVTGVENLTATVTFSYVPDCGCDDLVLRLYYERGRWLVRDAYTA